MDSLAAPPPTRVHALLWKLADNTWAQPRQSWAPLGTTATPPPEAAGGQLWFILFSGMLPIAIFLLALALRLWRLDVPINTDEALWVERGLRFWAALVDGHWAETFQRHHPGVTTMWLTGATYSLQFALRDWITLPEPLAALASQHPNLGTYLTAVADLGPTQYPLALYITARGLFALITSASLTGIYLLSRRLLGTQVALLAMIFLLFEPFFLAYQRFLTTDATLVNFSWLALLSLPLAWHPGTHASRRWLIFSAICYALALLSKLTALLNLPALGLWVLSYGLRFPHTRRRLLAQCTIWAILVGLTAVVLWPALWVAPLATLNLIRLELASELRGHTQFFQGHTVETPGLTYYLLVLLYRASPLLLGSVAVGLAALLLPPWRSHLRWRPLLAILVNVLLVGGLLSIQASQIDRYALLLWPGLAFVAAGGLTAVSTSAAPWIAALLPAAARHTARVGTAACLASSLLIGQSLLLQPHLPYLLTFFNPLLGGVQGAQQHLMIGNGELLDQAAAWLNAQPNAAKTRAASFYFESFAPYYQGQTRLVDKVPAARPAWAKTSYVVLYINQFQRQDMGREQLDYFRQQAPLYVVQAHGVDYAVIYPGPLMREHDIAALPSLPTVRFGEALDLLGYELRSASDSDDPALMLSLSWRRVEDWAASNPQIIVRLRQPDGTLINQTTEPPVGNFFPVDTWETDQTIRDVHRVPFPHSMLPGTYQVELGVLAGSPPQQLLARTADGQQTAWLPLEMR